MPIPSEVGFKQLQNNLQYAGYMLSTALDPQTAAPSEAKVIHFHQMHHSVPSIPTHENQKEKTSLSTKDIKQPSDYSKIEERDVVARAEQTLASTDKVTHESLTLTPHSKQPQTGLAQYGMWGKKATHDIQTRAQKASQRHSNTNRLVPNDTPIVDGATQRGSTFSINSLMQKMAEEERASENKSQWEHILEDPITHDIITIISMIPTGGAAAVVEKTVETVEVVEAVETVGEEKLVPLLEKVGMWATKTERDTPQDAVSLTPHEQLIEALNESKIAEQLDRIDTSSVIASKALHNEYEILAKSQSKKEDTELLSDGRILYYDKFRSAATEGPTIGSRIVTEYNPATGQITMWNEMYDQAGSVNRVRIKCIDGVKIDGPHFPLTLRERLAQEKSFHP